LICMGEKKFIEICYIFSKFRNRREKIYRKYVVHHM
jgi:hypothetical protein